jgi:hypothetical protein
LPETSKRIKSGGACSHLTYREGRTLEKAMDMLHSRHSVVTDRSDDRGDEDRDGHSEDVFESSVRDGIASMGLVLIFASGLSSYLKMIERRWPAILIIGALYAFPSTAIAQLEAGSEKNMTISTDGQAGSEKGSCAERIRIFVTDLDRVLDQKPGTVLPVRSVVSRGAPATNCDVAEITALVKASKYFAEVQNGYRQVVVIFKSEEFYVSFALDKETGNIWLPAAQVRCGDRACL